MAQAGNSYNEGPSEFAEDDYMPQEKVTPGATQNQSRPSGSAQNVLLIRIHEAAQFGELEENLEQTIEFIEKFTKDKETLGTTYNGCQEVLETEFQNLRDLLDRREDILKAQLTQRFKERDAKLRDQLEGLANHHTYNEEVCLQCKETVATMGDRKQKNERLSRIKDLCQTCIKKSPDLQEVPIGLEYSFGTAKDTVNRINDYGTLNFRRVAGGRALRYDQTVIDWVKNKRKIGAPNGPVYEPKVAMIGKSNLKYDRNNNSLSFEVTLNDNVDLNDSKESENNKVLLKESYEKGKTENTFLHIQCIGNTVRTAVEDWNSPTLDTFMPLSKLRTNGIKLVADVENGKFEAGMTVHGRVRLVYAENPNQLANGNGVSDDNFAAKSEWFKESKANFGKSASSNDVSSPVSVVNDELPQEEPMDDVPLPDRIKFKCAIDGGAAKTIFLKNKDNEIEYGAFLGKVQKKAKTDANFKFVLDNGQEILNNDDFKQHCVSGAEVQITATRQ